MSLTFDQFWIYKIWVILKRNRVKKTDLVQFLQMIWVGFVGCFYKMFEIEHFVGGRKTHTQKRNLKT